MSNVYGVWFQMGAYEGEDVLLGLYSSESNARKAREDYLSARNGDADEVYISKMGLDGKAEWIWDIKGELVDELA